MILLVCLFTYGAVAQLGERMTGSHEVRGSIPLSSTKGFKDHCFCSGFSVSMVSVPAPLHLLHTSLTHIRQMEF
jgi:hypothetical protein